MAVDTSALIVSLKDVTTRLELGTLNEGEQKRVADAILDVQAEVHTYLGVPLLPVTSVKTFMYRTDWELWLLDYVDPISVEYEPLDTGMTRVTVVHGYDAKNDPDMDPVRRYVARAVLSHPDLMALWSEKKPETVTRRMKSASTDGQSISYDYLSPDGRSLTDVAKANVPNIESLSYWRVAGRRVFQRAGFGSDPLPLYGSGRGYGGMVW